MKLASIFQDGMVLQQQIPIRIFGTSSVSGCLMVLLNENCVYKGELKQGPFSFELISQPANWGCCIDFYLNDEKLECSLHQVKVGEVWLAAGQSNMELSMRFDQEYEKQKQMENPGIFMYEVPKLYFENQVVDEKIYKQGKWYTANSGSLNQWCATGFYFAKKLYQAYESNIPIGIVSCNYGGSNMLSWLGKDIIQKDPLLSPEWDAHIAYCKENSDLDYELAFYKKAYEKQNYEYQHILGAAYMKGNIPMDSIESYWSLRGGQAEPDRHYGKWDADRPSGLYEYMLSKITHYTIRGVLWYQGEAESAHADSYEHTLITMIQTWRELWGRTLPFILVELAPFEIDVFQSGELFPYIRSCQQRVADYLEQVYSISIMDAGERHNIHPPYKRIVGERLAISALGNVYKFPIGYKYPEVHNVIWKKDCIVLSFKHLKQIYIKDENNLSSLFALYINKRKLSIKSITCNQTNIFIYCKEKPEILQYAYLPYCKVTIYNENDLPLKPFVFTKIQIE